jgi:hypothetical protein
MFGTELPGAAGKESGKKSEHRIGYNESRAREALRNMGQPSWKLTILGSGLPG